VDKLLTFNLEIDMDNIDIFVDHFVIHSESRQALILNARSAEEFKKQLRTLVHREIRQTLSKEISSFEEEIVKSKGVKRERLIDGSNALRDLRSDLLWAKVKRGMAV
tara:strand:- start:35 stop:355 length:321 start_codon:yes stop_codon:yes gene_type:complete